MPPHDTYIETHLGGGAIMQRKPPALRNIGIERNARVLERFQCDYPVERVHGCAHRFLADYPFNGRELVYSDPPYLHSVRTSSRRYRYDYTEQAHHDLLALLKGLPCAVILSGYACALYDEALSEWQALELQVMNQAGVRTEKLWFNFTPGKCQGSCRVYHVASVSELALPRGGFPGLSKTEADAVQSRVGPDQRVGLACLAAW